MVGEEQIAWGDSDVPQVGAPTAIPHGWPAPLNPDRFMLACTVLVQTVSVLRVIEKSGVPQKTRGRGRLLTSCGGGGGAACNLQTRGGGFGPLGCGA